jgi:glycosyltransferase involved in cell wall biosynthesis
MNILLSIHHHLDKNTGAPGVVMTLAEEYISRGHTVDVFSFDKLPSAIPEKLKAVVYPYFLARYIDKQRGDGLDVVDASTGDAWFWGKVHPRGSRGRTVLVTHSHGLEHLEHHTTLKEAEKGRIRLSWKYPIYHGGFRLWEVEQSLRVADAAFFLNREEMTFAVEELGISERDSRLIPNGIHDYLLGQTLSATPRSADEPVRIAQIGSYIDRKGIAYGKETLLELLEKYQNVEVGFFGTGCTEDTVLADFPPHLRERIHVVPRYERTKLAALLHPYQIQLFPTLSEGFGLALVEGMACGLAPVTTEVAGPKDIIENGFNGFLVQPANSGALREAVERLIRDRDLLDKLRRQALASAQEYSWRRIASRRLEIYEELIANTAQNDSGRTLQANARTAHWR